MSNLMVRIQEALRRESGATAVEYGLMVAFIAAVVALAVSILGSQVQALFQSAVGLF